MLSLEGFTALQESFTTQPVPMDRTTHPWNIRIPQTHHGCEQDMKRARAACTGEAANLQDSCIAASEYIHEAFDKAANALNKLGHALTSNEDDEYDKGDFDDEQDV